MALRRHQSKFAQSQGDVSISAFKDFEQPILHAHETR
jgi:hypothetical protein